MARVVALVSALSSVRQRRGLFWGLLSLLTKVLFHGDLFLPNIILSITNPTSIVHRGSLQTLAQELGVR